MLFGGHEGAEKGFPRAQFLLAEALRRGDGVERDDTEAAKWYRRGAQAKEAEENGRSGPGSR